MPYHQQLHDILIRQGYSYRRLINRRRNCDFYYDHFNKREISYYEDDSIESYENKIKMRIDTFDRVTHGIFSEDT